MSLRARPCSGPADLAGIIELLLACQLHGYAEAELRSIELRVFLNNPALDVNRLTLLLEDGEPLPAAFAVLWQGRYLGMLVRPDQRGRLETRVIEWAVEQARASDWPSGRQPTLTALCRDDDALSREIYESIGFSLRDLELRMVRDLHEPIPEPTFPEGFTLRTLDSTTELKDWLRLYSNEIGDRAPILERWRRTRDDEDHDQSLDLVAVDQSGKLAAMCYCSIPSIETARNEVKEGRTEPIAVAEPYRRRGLGRAMVLSGLNLLKERGMDQVLLTTESDNLPAHRLYESLGYRVTYNACWYVKPI
ncbi:MAG: GNAT family N-acetyltransferase [Nitrolancea sp.]